jgi:hypothetical protein
MVAVYEVVLRETTPGRVVVPVSPNSKIHGYQAPLCTGGMPGTKHRPRRMLFCTDGCSIQCPKCGFMRGGGCRQDLDIIFGAHIDEYSRWGAQDTVEEGTPLLNFPKIVLE